jgi:hypothetical protein
VKLHPLLDEYSRPKSRDRTVFRAEDIPADLLAALQQMEGLPADTPEMDAEVKDWKL